MSLRKTIECTVGLEVSMPEFRPDIYDAIMGGFSTMTNKTISGPFHGWNCPYCRSSNTSMRCESCGAPKMGNFSPLEKI